jgi:hypothetical protein
MTASTAPRDVVSERRCQTADWGSARSIQAQHGAQRTRSAKWLKGMLSSDWETLTTKRQKDLPAAGLDFPN